MVLPHSHIRVVNRARRVLVTGRRKLPTNTIAVQTFFNGVRRKFLRMKLMVLATKWTGTYR